MDKTIQIDEIDKTDEIDETTKAQYVEQLQKLQLENSNLKKELEKYHKERYRDGWDDNATCLFDNDCQFLCWECDKRLCENCPHFLDSESENDII
jgi:ABC-type oligopeptide transport system ATPase subunit